mmetsp:Transcript_62336/g.75028  ORF Transcript_62336/g.75028 Transcript_62336/m.75028 type:complete len:129 (-) Transcript_62336:174-560(-)|eukprot:CAMPEP_0194395366 /NCGR_PEP_ID=MMETSP0174-20130528/124382_1 /TAXON_ID=216777 /ORGANISM="Proboscia alata, Strain PI-D3" /LENGTH=128 /DNA_ID=CAMNT_0039191291 /DNA_START=591 /DNA_END=977 /DNA_ORIENTATION=-
MKRSIVQKSSHAGIIDNSDQDSYQQDLVDAMFCWYKETEEATEEIQTSLPKEELEVLFYFAPEHVEEAAPLENYYQQDAVYVSPPSNDHSDDFFFDDDGENNDDNDLTDDILTHSSTNHPSTNTGPKK